MMKLTKLVILTGLLLGYFTTLDAFADPITVDMDELRYTINTETKEAEVYGPTDIFQTKIIDPVIPDFIEYQGIQYPVTSIRDFAFYTLFGPNLYGSLTIGNNVTTIGENAFQACSELTGSLTIGNSVTNIKKSAFYCCKFTGSLRIPDSVITIGFRAFEGCTGFTGSLIIGNSVTTIAEEAFYNCKGFTGSLTLGNSVTTIGRYAFEDCKGFTGSLTIGDSVTTIGYGAFYDCSGFTGSLTIGDSVDTIGDFAFSGCSGFTGSLTIGDSVTTIGYGAFKDCSGFTGSLIIGNSVTSIGTAAFYSCGGFDYLYLPASLKEVELSAFHVNKSFNKIDCMATIPPILTGCFGYYTKEDAQLFVPAESIDLYKTAYEWRDFKYINPIGAVVSGIKLNKSSANLKIGESLTLVATIEPENAADKTIVWKSSNKNVASISNGTVTAIAAGVANITATCGEVSATCKVTVEPDVVRPETPSAFKRKGDGRSCTFVVMMNLSNEELTEQGYKFVYGYTDNTGMDYVIANTPLRYCHTSEQIYNDPSNDFWVFAYQEQENGKFVNSDRRHLDGSVDTNYDGTKLINKSRSSLNSGTDPDNWIKATAKGVRINIESEEDTELNIYTLTGLPVQSQVFEGGVSVNEEIDHNTLAAGIYIMSIKSGSKSTSKKIMIQ